MKKYVWFSGLLSAFLLCFWALTPVLAEETPGGRPAFAFHQGRALEATFAVELGEQVTMSVNGLDAASAADAVKGVLKDLLLRVRITQLEGKTEISASLEQRGSPILTGDVLAGGDTLVMKTSLLPGKSLLMPSAGNSALPLPKWIKNLLPASLGDALAAALAKYNDLISSWAESGTGIAQWTENGAAPADSVQTRNTAVRTLTVSAPGNEWKSLFKSLLNELIDDDALFQALSSPLCVSEGSLRVMARQWLAALDAPFNTNLTLTAGFSGRQELTDAGFELSPLTGSPDSTRTQGKVMYNRRWSDEKHKSDTINISLTWGKDGQLKAQLGLQDSRPNPLFPKQTGQEYGGRVMISDPTAGAFELEAAGRIRHSVQDAVESLEHTFDIRLSQKAKENAEGIHSLLPPASIDAGFILSGQTEALGSEDFRSHGTFTLNLMNTEAMKISYTLESHAYVPQETGGGYADVRLDELSIAERDALKQELEENWQRFANKIMQGIVK